VTTTTAFWKKSLKKTLDSEIHGFHFTTHQETQCCKIIRLWHIFKKVPPIGNFIRTRGLCTDISFLLFFTLAVNMKICNITLKFQPQCVKGVIWFYKYIYLFIYFCSSNPKKVVAVLRIKNMLNSIKLRQYTLQPIIIQTNSIK
jgi:hypothetical protein